MKRSLLVTNDFPPKIGGIQNYLWELWRRLPEGSAAVYATPYRGAAAFDVAQPFPIERSPEPVLLPYPWLRSRIRREARRVGAEIVILDPAVPLGIIGPTLGIPFGVVLHGAEVTIPGRLPVLRSLLGRTLRSSSLVISAGEYALAEAERCAGRSLPSVVIPPGVDLERFRPADDQERTELRRRFGIGGGDVALAVVTRLVPRKGMDTLVRAAAAVADRRKSGVGGAGLTVLIGGAGRQQAELRRLIEATGAPVRLLGRLSDGDVADLYRAADLMAMPCNERWFGLEQEGFGIVFLEAAACGIPQIAGRSGGAQEAVSKGLTGLVVDHPNDPQSVADAIEAVLDDPVRRAEMGKAARRRVVEDFDYQVLANRLHSTIQSAASIEPEVS